MNTLKDGPIDIRKTDVLQMTDPFLFVDRVTYLDPGKKVIVEKDVTGEEWFFKGHFPGNPILPGHILAEAMIQAGSFIFRKKLEKLRPGQVNYLAATKIRFFKITRPGATIVMTGTPVKVISSAGIIHVEARVDGELIARGNFTITTKDKEGK